MGWELVDMSGSIIHIIFMTKFLGRPTSVLSFFCTKLFLLNQDGLINVTFVKFSCTTEATKSKRPGVAGAVLQTPLLLID